MAACQEEASPKGAGKRRRWASEVAGADDDPGWWRPQPHASLDEGHIELRPAAPLAAALCCCLCRDVLREAITAPDCGHMYCYDCIESSITIGGNHNVCPVAGCSSVLGPDPFDHHRLKYDTQMDALVAKVFPRPALDKALVVRRAQREEATRQAKARLMEQGLASASASDEDEEGGGTGGSEEAGAAAEAVSLGPGGADAGRGAGRACRRPPGQQSDGPGSAAGGRARRRGGRRAAPPPVAVEQPLSDVIASELVAVTLRPLMSQQAQPAGEPPATGPPSRQRSRTASMGAGTVPPSPCRSRSGSVNPTLAAAAAAAAASGSDDGGSAEPPGLQAGARELHTTVPGALGVQHLRAWLDEQLQPAGLRAAALYSGDGPAALPLQATEGAAGCTVQSLAPQTLPATHGRGERGPGAAAAGALAAVTLHYNTEPLCSGPQP